MGNNELTRFGRFTLLLIPFVWLYEASAVGPTLGEMSKVFPGSSILQIQLIMVLPFLSSIIFSVVSGRLSAVFDKKTLVVTGLLIYGLTGMLPAFAKSINQILMLRFLTGVGVGLVLPLPSAIITEHFSGERRERMLGLATAVANTANIVASVMIGFVLLLGWQYPYYTFSLVLVIMIVAVFGLPKSPPLRAVKSAEKRAHLPGTVWGLALFMASIFMVLGFLIFNLALFMTSENLGTPWMIGIAMAVPAIGCTLAGAIFPELTRISKQYFVFASLVMFALGFGLLYSAHSFPVLMAACILAGFGQGALVPYVLYMTSVKVGAEHRDMAYGIVTSCIHFGYLASPFAQRAISLVSNNSSFRYLFLVASIAIIVAAVVALGFRKQLQVEVAIK